MNDIFLDSHDPSRDLGRERKIEVVNEPSFILQQYDPHGFWRVRREHGQIPDKLKGDYTTFRAATEAVEGYIKTALKPTKTKQV